MAWGKKAIMLGFGKKKKKETREEDVSQTELPGEKKETSDRDAPDTPVAPGKKTPPEKKKKQVSKKMMFTLLLLLIAVGASAWVVYSFYLAPTSASDRKKIYTKIELNHVGLPEEMLKFSFDYFPDLYFSLVAYNNEINLFDREIARIDAVAQKYPDQRKIADKEKKAWEKSRTTLEKAFLKIEKPIKETYVLFRVNRELGLARIDASNKELTDLARSALISAQEQTQKLKSNPTVPQGLVKGTLYKLKKKFL